MLLFWSVLIVVFGLLLCIVAVTCFRRYTQFVLAFVGMVLIIIGGTYKRAEERKQLTMVEADIKARTVVVRGTVDVKEERRSLKSPPPKNGGHLCLITLKELPYTFLLSERGRFGEIGCSKIKIRDIVRITFVRPADSATLGVDALEFVDLTYELNVYNVYKAIYQPVGSGRDSEGGK